MSEIITATQTEVPESHYFKQRHISEFKDFDWKTATKDDAISFARAKGFKETGMSVREIGLMYDLLERKGSCYIVELGRNYGCSTRLFLQHIFRHGGFFESWDLKPWPGFEEGMMEAGIDVNYITNVKIKIAHSIKTPITREDRFIDFLLIDTEHGLENALGEYMRWREYLKSGSFIAFHDSQLPAVARAIEIVKEVEEKNTGRISKEYINNREDGFGIHILEWKG